MADNTTLNPASAEGGDVVRSVAKTGGVKTSVFCIDRGGAGAEELVSAGAPLPVVAASLPLPTGAATETTLAAASTAASTTATALGAPSDAAAGTDSSNVGLIALFKRLLGRLTTLFPAALTGSGNFKVAVSEHAAGAAPEVNSVFIAGTLTTPTRVAVSVSTSGNSTLVAAVSGKRIVVLGGLLIADAAVTVKFVSGSTDITGSMAVGAGGGLGLSLSALGHLRNVNVNENLVINLSTTANIGGWLVYVTV